MTIERLELLVGLLVLAVAACGDDSQTGTGGGGSTTTSSSTTATSASTTTGASVSSGQGGDPSGTGGDATSAGGGTTSVGGGGVGGGGSAFPDDCAGPDDCPGGDCVEIGTSGFSTCRFRVEEALGCTSKTDECCTSKECGDEEICVFGAELFCAGPEPIERNRCVSTDDLCQSLDCGKSQAACIPPGVLGYDEATCASQSCFDDAECDEEPGGRCVPVQNPCCVRALAGFYCAYPSDGCRGQDDCGEGGYCEPDFGAGRARCVAGFPNCPQ